MDKQRILVVEDEISINDILTFALRKEGYDVRGVYNGKAAYEMVDSFKPDLVLLDIMLPDTDGFEICKNISNNAFVVMLTARNDVIDKVLGIEIGADDYITKPFEIREVLARIKSIFRRFNSVNISSNNESNNITNNNSNSSSSNNETTICNSNTNNKLIIHNNHRSVIKAGNEIQLKRKEFDLLSFLYLNKNIVFSREELLDKVWGYDFDGDLRTVDVHIRRIRARLGEEKDSTIIETVFGVGYVLRDYND